MVINVVIVTELLCESSAPVNIDTVCWTFFSPFRMPMSLAAVYLLSVTTINKSVCYERIDKLLDAHSAPYCYVRHRRQKVGVCVCVSLIVLILNNGVDIL